MTINVAGGHIAASQSSVFSAIESSAIVTNDQVIQIEVSELPAKLQRHPNVAANNLRINQRIPYEAHLRRHPCRPAIQISFQLVLSCRR